MKVILLPEEWIINECHLKWVSFVNRIKGMGDENCLNTGILAVKVLTNFSSTEVIQRIMINNNTICCLSSAQAVIKCALIYRFEMYIKGKPDIRGLMYTGFRGGAAPRAY